MNISFKENYQIDKLEVRLTGAKYYKRSVKVYRKNKDHLDLILESEISAAQNVQVLNLKVQASELLLEIHNQDNPPLVVKSLKAFQLSKSLISYLEKGKHYKLYFGDAKQQAPDYDLASFSDSITKQPSVLNLAKFYKNPDYATVKAKPNFNWLIWIAIATALLLLLFITRKMIKEIEARKT